MKDLIENRLVLDDSWIYKASVLADLVARQVAPIVHRVSGFNLSQWRVMAAVADKPGRTASQVVDVTPMDKGIVSRAVSTLVERKVLERRSSSEDGRLSLLFLTETGSVLYSQIVEALDVVGVSGRKGIDWKLQVETVKALDQIINAYRSVLSGPSPGDR